jgi:hypothetical protein
MILLMAGGISLFASANPDGLERVAIDAGFIDRENNQWNWALFRDYGFNWLGDHWLGNTLAGIVGVMMMFSVLWLLGKWLSKPGKG